MDLDRPFHGVRSIGVDLDTTLGRCRAYRPRLREGVRFSHSTAAILLGAPLPAGLESSPILHLTAIEGARPRTRSVVGHESGHAASAFVHGLPPIVAPADVWCQLAGQLSIADLVAVGDYLVSGERMPGGRRSAPICTLDELSRALTAFRPARGTGKLVIALPRIRVGVDSRPETHTRLVIVDAGLPEPVVGHAVDVGGGLVLHPDLAYPAYRIAMEYEGERHRIDRDRWERDIARSRALEGAGWIVIRVTRRDLVAPEQLLRDIRHALARRSA
ncbi:endonuclease domain-containing protein [Agromyces sp. NPDC056965]|uniref:endonuclease domain-containing protein n=1 Tax=Agromyces sp. NPDC056965 TaxID=3345983 RepID=UPI00362F7E1D